MSIEKEMKTNFTESHEKKFAPSQFGFNAEVINTQICTFRRWFSTAGGGRIT
jgi:hypothetical protein